MVISQLQLCFNHSVGAFTIYGIIYRFLQTALNAHTAKLYPASCRVIVNWIMSLFADHVQNSFPGLTACGPESSLWPWEWSASHATVKQTHSPSSLLEAASKERWQASEERAPSSMGCVSAHFINSNNIAFYVCINIALCSNIAFLYMPFYKFLLYLQCIFTNLGALCWTTLDTWQDCLY